MNPYLLSVLIPTIPERTEQFLLLMEELKIQESFVNRNWGVPVELLFDASPKFLAGGLSIGKKREALVRRASGKYVCLLDDDDKISPNYLQILVRLCLEGKDVCTFRNISKLEDFWTIVDMSVFHTENEQATHDRIVKRKPWHICPVKTKYAQRYAFLDINYGEDWAWVEQVLTHCQTEAHTDAIIHQYNYSSKTSEADKIITPKI